MALTGVVCSSQADIPKRKVSVDVCHNPSLAWGEQRDETSELQRQVSKLYKQQLEHHASMEQLLSKHLELVESTLGCVGLQNIPSADEASIANAERKPSTSDSSDVPPRQSASGGWKRITSDESDMPPSKSASGGRKQIAMSSSDVQPSTPASGVNGVVPGPEISPPSLVLETDEASAIVCKDDRTGEVNIDPRHHTPADIASDQDSIDDSKQSDHVEQSEERGSSKPKGTNSQRASVASTGKIKKCWLQHACHTIMHHKACEISVTTMICLSSLVSAIQSDWRIQNLDEELPLAFRVLDLCFTAGFTIELLMRIIDEGWLFASIYNKGIKWNLFDFCVVLAAILDELSSVLPNIKALRTLRVLRLARILRVLRVMRFFRDLRNMIAGILGSLQSLVWCLLLLFMLMFMYSLLVLQVLGDGGLLGEEKDEERKSLAVEHFGSLMRCMYTLCLSITGGVDWGDQGGLLLNLSPVLGCLHIVFMCFCILCVLNIVTSVFVEKAGQFTKADIDSLLMEDLSNREKFISDMREIFFIQAKGGDDLQGEAQELDEQEFMQYVEDKRVQAYFKKIGLHVEKENAQALFKMIDLDENGTVGLEEFVDGCNQFVGNARQLDIARLRHDNRLISQQIAKLSSHVNVLVDAVGKPKKVRMFATDGDGLVEGPSQPSKNERQDNQKFKRRATAMQVSSGDKKRLTRISCAEAD